MCRGLFVETAMGLRLIDDAHDAWKWSSVRFMAAGAAAQAALQFAPQRVLDYAPPWSLEALSLVSLACMVLGVGGRITTMEPRQ